ncbi:hypothetical protein HYU11_06085 [Candidatus Woesearchaeota archaeon]|nr:hypothetical protein [Candidatus Woesearchaeota archaeon]
MGLESKIKAAGTARKAIGYLLPFLDKYDYTQEMKKLREDPEISVLGYNDQVIQNYLGKSLRKNRALYAAAKLADTSDKATSTIVAPVLETLGTILGQAPGWLAGNTIEEGAEMALKMPFIAILAKRKEQRHYLKEIIAWEAASFTPVLGDIYDAATNMYIRIAKQVIREDAKNMMLNRDFTSGGRGLEEKLPNRWELAYAPAYAETR